MPEAPTMRERSVVLAYGLDCYRTYCDETEPQWPLRVLNDVWNTLAAWDFLIKTLYYENKLLFITLHISNPVMIRTIRPSQ
jgi:hypothetical protein